MQAWMYGTAWKEDETARLVRLALDAGFRAIDTANQRKHYFEAGAGEAIGGAIRAGVLARADLFLQTKFTPVDGQDERLPYDPSAPLATQVAQSFASSLEHLGVDYLDSYVLHGPETRAGLTVGDWETWRAMEALQKAGKTRSIGVSNVTLAQLEALHAGATVKPAIVQNRCYTSRGWDRAVRAFCAKQRITYQGFSLLTANREELKDPRIVAIASKRRRTVPQVIFRFAQQIGMVPLTGTRSAAHMAEDLAIGELELDAEEMRAIERIAG
jgi:diketogulonate reductase-like aldo/keto reductase